MFQQVTYFNRLKNETNKTNKNNTNNAHIQHTQATTKNSQTHGRNKIKYKYCKSKFLL